MQDFVDRGETLGNATDDEHDLLTIGSVAPALDIEHWVSDGEGRLPPVTEFARGQVYVVEFWATWCGPCIHGIPHLSELQQQYADRGVTIVSVSDEPLDTVTKFIDQPVADFVLSAIEDLADVDDETPADKPTYGEFTKHYCLTTDPDRSVNEDYMQAARQSGIPTAFVVGKTGHIEWIGHPVQLDEPLEQVVAGTWDRDAFASKFTPTQRVRALFEQAAMAVQQGEIAKARKIANSMRQVSTESHAQQLADSYTARLDFYIFRNHLDHDQKKAAELMPTLVEHLDGNAQQINQLTWGIVKRAEAGESVSDELLQQAADVTEAALNPSAPEGSLLDTIAHCYYHLGDLDRAIDFQRRAVEGGNDGQLQQQIEDYLQKLLAEKGE